MLHLLLGVDWVTIREEIFRRAALDVCARKPGRIILVPELISHDAERRLCASAGDTASRFAEVLSFPRLARRVAEDMGRPLPGCMDAGGRVVAMAAAAAQVQSNLKAYAAVSTKAEFLQELVDAVDECKRSCISAQDLAAASRQAEGSFAQKLEEIALMYGAYDSLCQQGKRDPRDLMTWLLEQLENGDFASRHVFYIDGFPDYTRQHMAILEHLIQASASVTVGLNCDSAGSDAMAFEKAGETAKQLLRCAKDAGVEVKIEVIPGAATDAMAACEALFQGRLPDLSQRGAVTAIQASSALEEVQAVADRILELVQCGCRYRDISVVCSDMATYQNLLRLQFNRCGIPLYQSGTDSILHKNGIGTVLAALEAALGGFEQRAVLRYLRSAMSGVEQSVCDQMENYALIWGIRGKLWLTPWENHPDGLSEAWTEDAQQRIGKLEQARSGAMKPLERLRDRFASSSKLSEQVEGLYAFLEEIRLAESLERQARELDAAGDNRSAQILNQLWEILLMALEQMHDTLGQTVWESDAFVRLFTLLLSQYSVGTIPPVLDAVMAGPVSAMRCQEAKHLFVLGVAEGLLPGYSGAKGVFNDQERLALRSMGVPLTGGAMEGLQAEFAEVYGAFCGGRQTITVTCSAEQPSYLYHRLAKMAGGQKQAGDLLGAALTDPQEAVAYLAALGQLKQAQALGLEDDYHKTLSQASHTLGDISREGIEQLYGDTLHLSASQIDRYAKCRLSYFLKYGLRAKERKEATVDPAEFGTFIHAVLEETARQVMELGGFHEVSLEKTMELALHHADRYTQEHFSQIDSNRLRYLFRRNRRELEMVVEELWKELKDSQFAPKDFELAFGKDGPMPPVAIHTPTMNALLRGFVDRVDIWEKDGKHYFRVVDYKTGKKDFDYCDVYNGVGLQMLLYLFALERGGEDVVGENPVAAGVQYFPARAPIVSADALLTDEAAEEARRTQWRRKGLLLNDLQVLEAMDPTESGRLCCTVKKDGSLSGDLADPKQLRQLEDYIIRFLENMAQDVASGNIQPNPYTRGTSHDACSYCPYGAICHKAEVEGRRNYQAMSPQRFWEEVGKECSYGG